MRAIPSLVQAYLGVKGFVARRTAEASASEAQAYREDYRTRSDGELQKYLLDLKQMATRTETLALVEQQLAGLTAEFAFRTLNLDPRPVQMLAAFLLHSGKVVQMNTGEGKTLLPPFHALMQVARGHRVLVLTANDYLARRDARWMSPLYAALGLSVASVADGDPDYVKRQAYAYDVVYASASGWVFDYLRYKQALSPRRHVPFPWHTVVIDEVDAILLDQGRSSFQLVQPVVFDPGRFEWAEQQVVHFQEDVHFSFDLNTHAFDFTDAGYVLLGVLAASSGHPFEMVLFHLKSALMARHLYRRDHEYLVQGQHLVPIDAFTGRPRPGQSFGFGVQQAIEQKEHLPLSHPHTVLNEVSIRNLLSRFKHVSGMSGSAAHNWLELRLAYRLEVIGVPPHTPSVREDRSDQVYSSREEQRDAATVDIRDAARSGRPVLVGTTNVADAEAMAAKLAAQATDCVLLTAKNCEQEAGIIAQAGAPGRVTIAAQMAGRGVDIVLSPQARAAGGLHVVGVGRARARRLDEQLQGRAGRQGEPGSSAFFISLEDDLMRSIGGKRTKTMMDKLGLGQGKLEHPIIDRSIRRAQRVLALHDATARASRLPFEGILETIREPLAAARDFIFSCTSQKAEVARLIDTFTRTLTTARTDNRPELVRKALQRLAVPVTPEIATKLRSEPAILAACLAKVMSELYYERRALIGHYGDDRERLILLRSIDYCWSDFLVRADDMVDSMLLSSTFAQVVGMPRELHDWMDREEANLEESIANLSVFYLLHIHEDTIAQGIKYWRGTGELAGGLGRGEGLDDGIPEPVGHLELEAAKPAGALPPLPAAPAAVGTVAAPSLPELLASYLASDEGTKGDAVMRQAVLRQFLGFVAQEDPRLDDPLSTLSRYLDTLEAQRIPSKVRREQRRELMRFLLYVSQRNRSVVIPAGRFARAGSRFKKAVLRMFDPWALLAAATALAFFLLVRWSATIPLPYLAGARLSAPAWFAPDAFRFVDQALLAGAWSQASVGILGLFPMLATATLLRLKSGPRFESPIVYLPLALVGAAVVAVRLYGIGRPVHMVTPFQASVVFAAVFLTTVVLTGAALLLERLEVLRSPLLFLLFGNVLLLAWRRLPTHALTLEVWLLPTAMLVLLLGLVFVHRKVSRVTVKVVSVGKFDVSRGTLAPRSNSVQLETVFGPGRYPAAFFIVAFADEWLRPVFTTSVDLGALSVPTLSLVEASLFVLIVWFLIGSTVRRQLPVPAIKRFLERRNSFVLGAEDWARASQRLKARIRFTILVVLVMETLVVWLAAVFCWVWIRDQDWLFWATSVLLATSFLVNAVATRTFGEPVGLVLSSSEPREDENVGIVRRVLGFGRIPFVIVVSTLTGCMLLYLGLSGEGWSRRVTEWCSSPKGIVPLVLMLLNVVQMFEYLKKLVEWIKRQPT